jgi:hypothetical protein
MLSLSPQASIGIIICKDKNRTTVEYALKDSHKPIGVSSYQLLHTLPSDLQSFLPSSEEIAQRLSQFDETEKKVTNDKNQQLNAGSH